MGGNPVHLNAALVMSLGGTDVWILIGRNDQNRVHLPTGNARSYATALVRLASVGKGIA